MKNSGQITVFLCLIMSGILLVAMTVISIINRLSAEEKAAIATKGVISDIKAEYNTYIFEHYHVLLFDKTLGGLSEADIEQRLENNISGRLGKSFAIEQAVVSDYTYIWQNECAELKKQIEDYTKYAVIKNEADKIMEKVGEGNDTLPDEVVNDIEARDKEQREAKEKIKKEEINQIKEQETKQDENKDTSEQSKQNENKENENKEGGSVKDPRNFTKSINNVGLLWFVIPEDMEISAAQINLDECISNKRKGNIRDMVNINMEFDDCKDMVKDMKSEEGWKDGLLSSACGLAYSVEVFNCAVNTDINDSSVLSYELEYLVSGKNTDRKNLEKTVARIVLLRFPQNYVYLISDGARMKKVMKIARSLAVKTKIPASVYKVLIAGCWSYVEGIADVRVLMKGEKIPFMKSNESWITDINHLGESIYEGKGHEDGTCYEDYIMMLLAINMNRTYFRMLDLMDMNASVEDTDFDIENGATGLRVDFKMTYGEKEYSIRQQGGY
ncbi:MAG: hypothetical protein K2G45_06650 [Lachnospiraceae bacterium]|nr:hypothetical protein [Lachnospiraceae bacterium]